MYVSSSHPLYVWGFMFKDSCYITPYMQYVSCKFVTKSPCFDMSAKSRIWLCYGTDINYGF